MKCQRAFQHGWLAKYHWMVYSPSPIGAFCLPCSLFATERNNKRLSIPLSLLKGGFLINWQDIGWYLYALWSFSLLSWPVQQKFFSRLALLMSLSSLPRVSISRPTTAIDVDAPFVLPTPLVHVHLGATTTNAVVSDCHGRGGSLCTAGINYQSSKNTVVQLIVKITTKCNFIDNKCNFILII